MGFSVSGSAAIIFIGLFIAFGMWQTAATNGFERVSEAHQDRSEAMLAQQNAAIEIQNASYDTDSHNNRTWYLLDLRVSNNGSRGLSVMETDVLIDNSYQTGWEDDATVDDTSSTDLWLPGETLLVEFNESTRPERVKVTSETGVSASTGVTAR